VVLRVAADEAPVAVNGTPCREAALRPGDQLVLGNGQRLVVEAPVAASPDATPATATAGAAAEGGTSAPPPASTARRLPLLLVAALLLAAALSALLLL